MKIIALICGLFLIISLPLGIIAGEFDLTVEIAPGTHQCFFQVVSPKHKSLEIDYQVNIIKLCNWA